MGSQHGESYREIFDSCVEGILVIQKGKIVLANPQCHLLFGYPADELIGGSIEQLIPTDLRSAHVKYRDGYAANPSVRQMGAGRDLLAQRKDGSVFPVEISLNPGKIFNESSTIAHVIDITERKKVEGELKKSETQLIKYATQLERMVQDRTKELDEAINGLKKSNIDLEKEVKERVKAENEANIALEKERELNELKTRFVSMASHEFRTPLSTILSSASLIAKYTKPDQEEKKVKHINRIKSNVAELTSILNDFLSLDRLDTGLLNVFAQQVNVKDLIRDIVSNFDNLARKGQKIITDCNVKTDYFQSDPQILRQIIVNLISNAIKYSPENSEILLRSSGDESFISIEVIDQGIGIPVADQKHLFTKFYRAHNASHIQGTGLGLNIVNKYLELIKGEISFQSEEGKGSTFTVTIKPIQEDE